MLVTILSEFGSCWEKTVRRAINNTQPLCTNQGGWGHWPVDYTSPQSFIIAFCYSLTSQLWGLLLNFDWLVRKLCVQTFQRLIEIYKR